ncbi:hypothetical protein UlMin_022802 [Ulmus minor]
MDRRWISNPDRLSAEYEKGVGEFVTFVRGSLDVQGLTKCPCNRCMNREVHHIDSVRYHLLIYGFLKDYIHWTEHGEQSNPQVPLGSPIQDTPPCMNDQDDEMAEALRDAAGHAYDIGSSSDLLSDMRPPAEQARYDKLFEELHNPLYDDCMKFSALTFIVKLMNVKVLYKWSDRSFVALLKLLHEALPVGNRCPRTYYETRKLLCDVGLGYEHIDICKHDCTLFYNEHKDDDVCPICGVSRYVRKKIPHKRLRYFPITPRLKRLYSSKHTARAMRWHKEQRLEKDGKLRHPADGEAWKKFDSLYPEFAGDPRSVRMGLASDGFNPFSHMSTSYSMWPVILIPYNLPPWLTMHRSNYLLSLLIPGPKSPGKDFDVFLRPLIEELKVLWDGVQSFDSYQQASFTLRASVIWTVSDFPAFAYLSGWSTQGKLACPICLEDTRYKLIRSKISYIGHRSFLEMSHSWRNSKEFDGRSERRAPPRNFSTADILSQLEAVGQSIPGKATTTAKRKRLPTELNWTKKSILFELPYWSTLLLRHNLDVMHIEKNVCDNILGTLLDIEGKSKDNDKAREDLKDMGIRSELWLQAHPVKGSLKPHASYVFTKDEAKLFCDYLRAVKLPDGYASNIGRCVTESNKLAGMKSHDCHVLLQKLLPPGILTLLTPQLRRTLIELSQFFEQLCGRTLDVGQLTEMRRGIVIILCKLEKIFPPSFFTIMVHLCVHLPDQALLGGPVSNR